MVVSAAMFKLLLIPIKFWCIPNEVLLIPIYVFRWLSPEKIGVLACLFDIGLSLSPCQPCLALLAAPSAVPLGPFPIGILQATERE